jgi:dTDP-4-amino-4,6-dideoxygalactose transaminase
MTYHIGSEYPLSLSTFFKRSSNKVDDRSIFLSTGRCAIHALIQILGLKSDDEVLIPTFTCRIIPKAFQERGVKVVYYRITPGLEVDLADLKKSITKKTKLAYVIHYFGFAQKIDAISKICREKKILLLEDCTHAMFTTYNGKRLGDYGDYSLATYRKWFAIPDGAYLRVNNSKSQSDFDTQRKKVCYQQSSAKIVWTYSRLLIMLAKAVHQLALYKYYLKLELGVGRFKKPAPMSTLSKMIYKKTDLTELPQKRRDNFMTLQKSLKSTKVKPFFRTLPQGVCPYVFPVLAEDRDKFRDYLISKKIYCDVHWSLEWLESEKKAPVKKLSEQIISLPIDQRYYKEDIEYLAEVVNEY